MKQGKPVITFAILVFAAAVAIYFGYYVATSFHEPYQYTQVYAYTVVLSSDGKQQIIYKHAISTIVPERPVSLSEPEEDS